MRCVQHFVDVEHIDPRVQSHSQEHTAFDFSVYAHSRGVSGADEVVDFLRTRLSVDAESRGVGAAESSGSQNAAGPSSAPGRPLCEPGVSHPPGRKRRGPRVNWMLQAAAEGCKTCVQYYVRVETIDPPSRSENAKYTALDWATWATSQNVAGASEVAEFLREQAPDGGDLVSDFCVSQETAAREAGLNTPLSDNVGAGMMAQMGWEAGQPLGARADSGARMEPVRPDTSRCGKELRGVGYVGKKD